ncbi:CRP-like cAMP-binding protein [Rhizomicrobium palustre]|uniref:CRP-like cAMP-binding protein n=1 Tax=Rhizomicrobium palustre TaxID=189966 RepID=A0A846MYG1_9PROT|nr:cyclic nucleotide-binding domain-containing protein [Rhizomicrobium palustre]NIK88456.1 CRP-like cAMP-binding protein [Rhizomicrobium palustre]
MEGLHRIVAGHSFFAGMAEEHINVLTGCAKNVRFEPEEYLFHEGDTADQLYLLRAGTVALEVNKPGASITIQTVGEGEIVGASWLVPPYRRGLSARAVDLTRALAFDAACLRGKCEADHDLGYEMMKRFLPILIQRLRAARRQILEG